MGKPGERDQWGDLVVGGCIILGRICGEMVVYMILVGKPGGKSQMGKPRRRWVDNIRKDLWCEVCVLCLGGETGGKESTGGI